MDLTLTQIKCLHRLAKSGSVRPINGKVPGALRGTLLALERRGLVFVTLDEQAKSRGWFMVLEFGITSAGCVALAETGM